jgi:UDP-2,4-diacetamido-2,4,6-trideoxy-beta-L-altropyranose hydrolase
LKKTPQSTDRILFVRADSSVDIGTGHVMRMLALGQAWRDLGGQVVFLCAEITPSLESRLNEEGFRLEKILASSGSREDLDATCSILNEEGREHLVRIVLDGYHFDSDFQSSIRTETCPLLVMDDYGHLPFYDADWILNQNISASPELYSHRSGDARLLLGTEFCLLRQEFLKYQNRMRAFPPVARNLLLTLGGSDPDNITWRVIDSLADSNFHIKVVVGGSNPHLPVLREVVEKSSNSFAKIELLNNPKNMPDLMAWADLAVAAGGSTAWELAFMGLPSLYFVLAENQRAIARKLEMDGMGLGLNTASGELDYSHMVRMVTELANNPEQRHQISLKCQRVVDGLGSRRVASLLMEAL